MFGKYRTKGAWYETPGAHPIEEGNLRLSQDAKNAEDVAQENDGETVLKIGRYRGHTYASVSRNAYYVRWVKGIAFPKGQMGRLRSYLEKNADWLLKEQIRESREMGGTLSNRVRKWPLDELREQGILRATPEMSNCTIGNTRRPRAPTYGLQATNIIPQWEQGMTKSDKWRVKCMTGLVGRFMSYVFRHMIHEVRKEAISERVVADKALEVLERNDYAYRLALKLSRPKNDPEGKVSLEELEGALQARRSKLEGQPAALSKLPTTLAPCLTRLGCTGQSQIQNDPEQGKSPTTTPRRILLRFMLSIGELGEALKVYRSEEYAWSDEIFLRACWTMARADGAFSYDKINNESIPEALLAKTLPIYAYMQRVCSRHFTDAIEITYGACVGFGDTGCPMEVDIRVGDTVWAFRSGMWISNKWDFAYLQGYALAREHGVDINRACIAYFQHGCVLGVDLDDWDHIPLLSFLKAPSKTSEHISEAEAEGNACDLGLCDEPSPDVAEEQEVEAQKEENKAQRRKRTLGWQAMQ
jgi:uncharacterized protein (DUF3820 family)